MAGLVFRSKYRLFAEHHARLLSNPEPGAARERFEARIRDAKRTQALRTLCYAGLYFSIVGALATGLLGRGGTFASVVGALAGVAASLSILFAAGLVACNRYLGLVDVELYYYSAESRKA